MTTTEPTGAELDAAIAEAQTPKPCPFCGGDALLDSVPHYRGARKLSDYFFRCRSCAACGPWMKAENEEDGRRRAIRLWNRRVG